MQNGQGGRERERTRGPRQPATSLLHPPQVVGALARRRAQRLSSFTWRWRLHPLCVLLDGTDGRFLMQHATVLLDTKFCNRQRRIAVLFGAFMEHLGRCVYGGLFEPDHPTAEEKGFRRDVIDLVRELGPTIIRYPGGNFVSGLQLGGWRRPSRRLVRKDWTWRGSPTEPNTFGTNEFVDWCKAADVEPMFAVNLGTRAGDAAKSLVEYCNHPSGTHYSDRRRPAWIRAAARDQILVPRERNGWSLANGVQDRNAVRPRR